MNDFYANVIKQFLLFISNWIVVQNSNFSSNQARLPLCSSNKNINEVTTDFYFALSPYKLCNSNDAILWILNYIRLIRNFRLPQKLNNLFFKQTPEFPGIDKLPNENRSSITNVRWLNTISTLISNLYICNIYRVVQGLVCPNHVIDTT